MVRYALDVGTVISRDTVIIGCLTAESTTETPTNELG